MRHFLATKSARDLEMQYTSSLVMYKGDVVEIRGYNGHDEEFVGAYLSSSRAVNISRVSPDLDTMPVKLGYMNGHTHPVYVSRRGVRKYRQGLSGQSIQLTGYRQPDRGGWLTDDALLSRCLPDTIQGNFPKYSEAIAILDDPKEGPYLAFDRYWCLLIQTDERDDEQMILYWKDKCVGRVAAGVPILQDKYTFLHEGLKEAMR